MYDSAFHVVGLYLMSGTMPQAIGPVNLGFDDILLNFDDWLPVLYDVGV